MAETTEKKTFLETDGHEHFKPIKAIKGSDQMRLIAQLRKLGVMSEDTKKRSKAAAEAEAKKNIDLEKMADLIDYVGERFTHDPQKFDEWTMGPGGFERALEVTIAFASLVGEDNGSGN